MARVRGSIIGPIFFAVVALAVLARCMAPYPPTDANPSPSTIVSQPAVDLPQIKSATPTKPIDYKYVTASSLNLRSEPNAQATILAKLGQNERVAILDQQAGWLYVEAAGYPKGWISEQYAGNQKASPPQATPKPQQTLITKTCPGRLTCGQISSCKDARWYLANCSWGGRLDGDGDGVPCESMCG